MSEHQVTFADAALTIEKDGESSLVKELFGEIPSSDSDNIWDPTILASTKSEIRSGLKAEIRQDLLKKYESKGHLEFLNPPKINKELLAALSKRQSVLKRDEYQTNSQSQVAACINALGSGISDLLNPQHNLPSDENVKRSLTRLADCMRLLSDHHYRLSISRQAFIKPCLTFVGKTAADSASVDTWLFGSSFAEEFKTAQACEKAARELTRTTPVRPTSLRPPTRSPLQPLPQQQIMKAGNPRAPTSRISTTARQSRAMPRASRAYTRYRSKSRTRR